MITIAFLALLLGAIFPPELPFTIEATEDVSQQFPGAPRIQSFSFAQWKGKWVFIGGRIAGYHSVGGGNAEFLRKDANTDVWVVDASSLPARTYHASVNQLPESLIDIRDQWTSTGQLYVQDGSKLYIAGGYGQNHLGKWVTFPIMSRVDLPALIDGTMKGRIPASAISYVSTPLAQAAGGELLKLPDGLVYLVMGHIFMGSYTAFEGHGEHNSEEVSQKYLGEIRSLRISETSKGFDVKLEERFADPIEFHRRDLTVAPFLSPKGIGLAAYGGVFTPDTQLSYSKPVYLLSKGKPEVDNSFGQKMNAYECARLAIYDNRAQTMYTTFFGGISRNTWDVDTKTFVENARVGSKSEAKYLDGLQWSDQISTIKRVFTAGGSATTEAVHSACLPGFIGANGVFIANPELKRAHPNADILDLAALQGGRVAIGYIYGGIRAFPYRFPYNKSGGPYNSGSVPTKPNDTVLKVYLKTAP